MNFYKHYIGDFQRDTGHLSLTERGAYLALIHHYYATEKPLPAGHDALCRIAGAFTTVERKAVKVAMAFFTVVESGLMHNRIEAELHKAGEISNTNRDIALAREAKRRADKDNKTEHESSTNRAQSVPRTEHEHSTPQTPDTIKKEQANACLSTAKPPTCPHHALIDLFGQHLPTMPQPKKELWSGANEEAMRARWRWVLTAKKESGERYAETVEQGLEWFGRYFSYVKKSDFLMGRTPKPWTACDLGWLMKAANFEKVVQGNYENKGTA